MISQAVIDLIPDSQIQRARHWIREFSLDWQGDVPMQIHEGRSKATQWGVSPAFTPQFIAYIGYLKCSMVDCTECKRGEDVRPNRYRNSEQRLRTTKAFRKLRNIAPREFDMLYMLCALRMDVEAIAHTQTIRAIKNGHPERYTPADIVVLAISGVEKVLAWW